MTVDAVAFNNRFVIGCQYSNNLRKPTFLCLQNLIIKYVCKGHFPILALLGAVGFKVPIMPRRKGQFYFFSRGYKNAKFDAEFKSV